MLNDVEYLRGDLNCFNKINNYSAKHCYILNHVCYIFLLFIGSVWEISEKIQIQ